MLHLIERVVRALVFPALRYDISPPHREQGVAFAPATLTGLVHVGDATVSPWSGKEPVGGQPVPH